MIEPELSRALTELSSVLTRMLELLEQIAAQGKPLPTPSGAPATVAEDEAVLCSCTACGSRDHFLQEVVGDSLEVEGYCANCADHRTFRIVNE